MKTIFLLAIFFSCGVFFCDKTRGEETESPKKPSSIDDSQVHDLLRSNLELQDQLHTALRAIEQARQDADTAAKRNAELFTERINAVEKNLSLQREHYLESMVSMRQANRFALIAAAIVAVIGMLALFLMAYFLVRAMNRTAEIGTILSSGAPLDSSRLLNPGNSPARLNPTDQVTARFFAAIEELEKRIHQLDFVHPLSQRESFPLPKPLERSEPAHSKRNPEFISRSSAFLVEGQGFLNGGDVDRALVYFDRALEMDPANAEAWVKKGTALEAQRKMHEAIESYDRAIATDNSMTVAYLYKGGALNRLQRFSEAMECYEQALRAHNKKVT